MDQDQDFSQLRNLLALKRMDIPVDTQVDRFLIEFHRRQRAQLLVPASTWGRLSAWVQERLAGFGWAPSLSYGAVFAALAVTVLAGLSQQVDVTSTDDASHPYKLSFHLPTRESSFAMIPVSFTAGALPKRNEIFNKSEATPTRFVLANNPRVAYDATVAF